MRILLPVIIFMLFVSNCNETDNKTNSKDITIIENVELNEGKLKNRRAEKCWF